ncbi:MAG: phosphoenolpyruvate carboxykinase (ATP), partial [Candidatus Kapabacteria bacterium]|nr:phosphoenolpyruvate carboxykinase (ATP) [Candidatus Kapabacteria bacterium]
KAVFTVTGYALMLRRVLPMRCAAIADPRGYTALLIGANGSGKTTLSVHSSYKLLGDDAHAWSDDGIFTLENGVYAKALNITRDTHTSIYNASQTFGTILENVVCDSTSRTPLFDDTSISDNARISISNDALGLVQPTIPQLRAEHPKTVLLLIHDPLGVLPLAARLSHEQAAFLFLSGYSAKHPHTVEPKSDTKLEPKVVFTATFGEVFMLQDPVLHTQLFYERLHKHKVQVWLINTGWYGGTQFTGRRIALDTTRALVHAILAGNLDTVEFAADPIFHVHIPTACPNVPSNLFQTRHEWSDSDAYDKTAYKLLALLTENAQKYAGKIDTAILHAFTSSPPLHTPAHDTAQPASQKKSIRLSQRRTTAPQNINIEQDVLSESLQSKDTQAGVSRRNQRRKSVASDEANAGNASIAHEHTLDNTVLFGGTRASTEDIYVPPSLFAPLEGEYRPSHEQASMTYVSDTEENNDARHSDMVHDADVPAGLQGQSQYRGPRRRSPRTRRHAR